MTSKTLILSAALGAFPSLVYAHSGPVGQSPSLHASAHLMEIAIAGLALGGLVWLGLRAARKRS